MNTDTRTWTRLSARTIMVELMGAPAYVYTVSNDTDAAVDLAAEHHGAPLDCGEPEEYCAEFAGEETDYPELDGPALPCEFLAEYGDREISVISVWVPESGAGAA